MESGYYALAFVVAASFNLSSGFRFSISSIAAGSLPYSSVYEGTASYNKCGEFECADGGLGV